MNTDVVISGCSVPALMAALDFAQVGLSVLVVADNAAQGEHLEQAELPEHTEQTESRGHFQGTARTDRESQQPATDAEGHLRSFLNRLAEPIEGSGSAVNTQVLPVAASPTSTVLRDTRNQWAPLAEPNVLGIPVTPLDAAVLRLIGTKASFRAYVDRIRPVLTLGKTKLLGELVRQRMGSVLRDRIVDPLIFERFGVSANAVDVALAAPGLNEALTRQGSLSTAALDYSDRYVARETRISPAGGEAAVIAELTRKLELYNGKIVASVVESAQRHSETWAVQLADGTTVNSRAFVIDFGGSALAAPLQQRLCPHLSVNRLRVHARCVVELPAGIAQGQSALWHLAGWSLRITPQTTNTAQVTLSSDVCFGEDAAEAQKQSIAQVLSAAQLMIPAGESLAVRIAAAPFATHEQREQALAEFSAVIDADPMLLPVGQALYGDDLGHTLHETEAVAVLLRRRLLGLID